MAVATPNVFVRQEFNAIPAEIVDAMRAHISGPNAMLHRYAEAAEKALIGVGEYNRQLEVAYPWPDREAGSLVDEGSVRLFADDALLLYFEDLIGDSSSGRGTVTVPSGRTNRVRSSTVNFKTNGDNLRHALLYDRDVKVGDRVYVRGVADPDGDCTEVELWTYVTDLLADTGDGTIEDCAADAANQASTEADTTIEKTGGVTNCVTATADGSAYDGLASGHVTETYTIEVVKSSVAGCTAARLRVTSASGTDDADEVEPSAFGDPTDIGTRGLTVTFDLDVGTCSLSADSSGVESGELIVGQTWEVVVTMDFEAGCCESGGSYTGPVDDTYIVEVTKGGVWADLPEITVTTIKGLDSRAPVTVTGAYTAVPVGNYDVTVQFIDCFGSNASEADYQDEALGGDTDLAGLRKGDKFHIQVTTGQDGAVKTLVLRHDVPASIRSATDLDLRLFLVGNIEITENRVPSPPNVNFEIETTQLVVQPGISVYHAEWTDDGDLLPLQLYGGSLYIEYREWLAGLTSAVNFIDDVSDIDVIPGPLDEANPLKWGVFRALQNSNGTRVGYTAVADPDSLDSWQLVLDRVDGRDDIYYFAAMTDNREVHNLFQAHVNAESSEEGGNWKALAVSLVGKSSLMLVGQSSADAQALRPTSEDGELVLATIADDPDATGTQYTILSVPGANSGFITYGVKAGDTVRTFFTVDGFGDATYTEYVVDAVLSENTLRLLAGPAASVTVAQKTEVWRPLSKSEIVADLIDQAQSYADFRVIAVWPDLIGTAGNTQPGHFLAAALIGEISALPPHQSMTRRSVAGFDDAAARTRDFFSDTQLTDMAGGGIWIVTEDRDGTLMTRHALTTDTSDLNHREEMIRRNLDSISYLFRKRMEPFIGQTNAVRVVLDRITYEINQTIRFLKTNQYSASLGAQLIDGAIRIDPVTGEPIVRLHPLAADHIEVVVDLLLPFATNYITVSLVV